MYTDCTVSNVNAIQVCILGKNRQKAQFDAMLKEKEAFAEVIAQLQSINLEVVNLEEVMKVLRQAVQRNVNSESTMARLERVDKAEQQHFASHYDKTMAGVKDLVDAEKKRLDARFERQIDIYWKSLKISQQKQITQLLNGTQLLN